MVLLNHQLQTSQHGVIFFQIWKKDEKLAREYYHSDTGRKWNKLKVTRAIGFVKRNCSVMPVFLQYLNFSLTECNLAILV